MIIASQPEMASLAHGWLLLEVAIGSIYASKTPTVYVIKLMVKTECESMSSDFVFDLLMSSSFVFIFA